MTQVEKLVSELSNLDVNTMTDSVAGERVAETREELEAFLTEICDKTGGRPIVAPSHFI